MIQEIHLDIVRAVIIHVWHAQGQIQINAQAAARIIHVGLFTIEYLILVNANVLQDWLIQMVFVYSDVFWILLEKVTHIAILNAQEIHSQAFNMTIPYKLRKDLNMILHLKLIARNLHIIWDSQQLAKV